MTNVSEVQNCREPLHDHPLSLLRIASVIGTYCSKALGSNFADNLQMH